MYLESQIKNKQTNQKKNEYGIGKIFEQILTKNFPVWPKQQFTELKRIANPKEDKF